MSEYIFHSPLAPVNIPQVHITDYVFRNVGKHANQVALIDGCNGVTYTFSELISRTRRLAGGLCERGFKKGDVLALVSPNCPDYAVVFHATALCGGTVTTVNPAYGIAELRQQLKDSGASWIIADQGCTAVCKLALNGTGVSKLFSIQDNTAVQSINSLLADEIEQVAVDLHSHAVVLPYSSGTTGLPKGVMLSHSNLVANLVQMNTTFDYGSHETALAILPFFHIFGMQVLMGSMLAEGHMIVTLPRFDMEKSLRLIQQHAVSQFYVVPPVVLGLAKSPLVDKYNLTSLKKILSGAAPLGSELCEEAKSRIDCDIVQGYGMTELSPVSHATPGIDGKPGSSGVTLPNTQSRIVDSNGNDLPPDTEGELWVKGPQVMIGYLNNSEATAATLDAQGWLHTGDLARIDNDGYLTIVDRVKELIKCNGFQVAPAELEALLITHSSIADVAVVGVPDDEAGEVPKAFVTLKDNAKNMSSAALAQTESDIKAFVSKNLATYKAIRYIEWIDAIPKAPSGKILRRELRVGSNTEPA